MVDSTNTYPAQMVIEDKDEKSSQFILNKCFMQISPSWKINHKYGRIEVGVKVDTFGKTGDYRILTSYSPLLDTEAIQQMKEKKWIPARKNGIRVASDISFNMVFENTYILPFRVSSSLYEVFLFSEYYPYLDRQNAKILYSQGDYANALLNFTTASKWFFDDPEIFYNKAVVATKLNSMPEACKDFQKSKDLAEKFGYPYGMSKENLEQILSENCR